MNSTSNNFFKSKPKVNNLYASDGIKINYENLPRGKTSCSPNRNIGLCDIMKKNKLFSKLNIVNGTSNPYKLMDIVKI
jgi:hypothetical protein